MYEDIKKLADELMEISKIKNSKYPFQHIHLEKLIEKWNSIDTKYEIHMLDLPKHLIVNFDKHGKRMLQKICYYLRDEYGLTHLKGKYKINLYNLYDFVKGRSNGISTESLVKLFNLLKKLNKEKALDLELLEKHITEIKTRKCKIFKPKNGLPIYLNNEKWAYFFGLMLDSGIHKFQFYSKENNPHKEIRNILKSFGYEITERKNKTMANSIFSNIFSLSGIDTFQPQQISNNVLPYWVFTNTTDMFKHILLTKTFEAEGSFSKDSSDIRITQSAELIISKNKINKLKDISREEVIKYSGSKILKIKNSEIPRNTKKITLETPPLILVSLQLLLRQIKINSNLCLNFVYITNQGKVASMWDLHIFGKDLNKFRDLCLPFTVLNKFNKFRKRREALSQNTRLLYYLLLAKEAGNKKDYFFTKDVISLTNRKSKNIWNNIAILKRKGFIETLGLINRTNKLRISKKGLEFLNQNINSFERWNHLFE